MVVLTLQKFLLLGTLRAAPKRLLSVSAESQMSSAENNLYTNSGVPSGPPQ